MRHSRLPGLFDEREEACTRLDFDRHCGTALPVHGHIEATLDVAEVLPMPKAQQTLPVILSPEEVWQLLSCVPRRKGRTILTLCYAARLRVSEAIALKPTDIDSQRMMIRVEQGKGQKDRHVMLSEELLKILREWYRFARPTAWMFPGVIPGSHITRTGVGDACELGLKRSGLTKPVSPHSLRHYVSRLTAVQLRKSLSEFLVNFRFLRADCGSITRHSFRNSQVL